MALIKVTEELYKANIPDCCQFRTFEEHMEIMLCWGLVSSIEQGKTQNCSFCDFRIKGEQND